MYKEIVSRKNFMCFSILAWIKKSDKNSYQISTKIQQNPQLKNSRENLATIYNKNKISKIPPIIKPRVILNLVDSPLTIELEIVSCLLLIPNFTAGKTIKNHVINMAANPENLSIKYKIFIYSSLYSHPGCQDFILRQSSSNACPQVLFFSNTSKASCGALCATIATFLPS